MNDIKWPEFFSYIWAWIILGMSYIMDWAIIVDIYIHIYVMILYALCVLIP